MQPSKQKNIRLLAILLLLASFIFLTACSSSSESDNDNTANENMEMENTDNGGMEDMEHEDEHAEGEAELIPNDGAVIRILSPADGATFAEGDEIIVEVEFENFEVGVDGNHWHISVDGSQWGMVMGGSTDEVLRGLEPGEHAIDVVMANGDHQDFEDGDTIHITVE